MFEQVCASLFLLDCWTGSSRPAGRPAAVLWRLRALPQREVSARHSLITGVWGENMQLHMYGRHFAHFSAYAWRRRRLRALRSPSFTQVSVVQSPNFLFFFSEDFTSNYFTFRRLILFQLQLLSHSLVTCSEQRSTLES